MYEYLIIKSILLSYYIVFHNKAINKQTLVMTTSKTHDPTGLCDVNL